jgi:transaldolase
MDITKLPETLTYNQVKALRAAFGHFYDQESGAKFVDAKTGFHFDNVTGFVDYLYSPEIGIPKGTSVKHIGIVLESWYETLSKAPEFTEPTMTPAPEYAVSSNTLTPDQLKQLEKEEESRSSKLKETRVKSEKNVEEALKRKQENWEKLQQQKLPKVPTKYKTKL